MGSVAPVLRRHRTIVATMTVGVAGLAAGCTAGSTATTAGPEATGPGASTTVPGPDGDLADDAVRAPATTWSAGTTAASVVARSTTTTVPASTTTTTTVPAGPPATTTTAPAAGPAWFDLHAETTTLGHSVQGRPIVAERIGDRGGRPVVVIGVIHGDEDDGVAVIDELRTGPAPDGVELWLVESMNPDGQEGGTRGNAHGVDLNRNFPHDWGPIGEPGDPQYAGTGPASEPETQAVVNLLTVLRPDITIWYHQDLFTISPSTGREGRVRARYAELTGLPQDRITGGTYTGVAATWARDELGPDGSVAFIVELGPTLSRLRAGVHADAVRTIAAEG